MKGVHKYKARLGSGNKHTRQGNNKARAYKARAWQGEAYKHMQLQEPRAAQGGHIHKNTQGRHAAQEPRRLQARQGQQGWGSWGIRQGRQQAHSTRQGQGPGRARYKGVGAWHAGKAARQGKAAQEPVPCP